MNKIYKVMYSKVKQCAVVVSEIAKSHGHNGESSGVRKHAALTAAVLIALGSLSFTTAFVPMTAEAADKTRTDGSDFVGVERTNGLIDESKYENSGGKGAQGADSITLGLRAQAGAGTITIGDRRSSASMGSVYVGHGDFANPKLDTGGWVTSIGYHSDATGYGSIALGSNAVAKNSYAEDSKGNSLKLNDDNDDTKFRLNPKPDIQRASVAIGYGANADNGNIAIGSYSDASTDLRTVADDTAKAYLTEETADSYVSVGKTGALRRISNVADGAADSDVATIGQLKALSDKAGVYNEGWGIKIDKTNGNTISVNHNLGNNMNAQLSSTGLILGGDFSNTYDGKYGGAAGDYAVTLGGESNFALGNISVIAGGYGNHASGKLSFIGGGNNNVATGSYSANLGGTGNTASGESSVVTGGAYNTASGTKSFVGGGHGNIAVGDYSAVIGGWDNRALGDPYGSSITTVVGGYRNTANGYHAMVTGGYQNVAWGRDTLVSGGRYNTVLGEMEDGWTDQRLSDASAFGGEGSVVQGLGSVGLAGGSTGKTAYLALAAGYQSVVTDGAAKLEANFSDYEILPVYKDIASAIGYQSTANEAGTISFGHDAGDVSGYTVNWEEDKDPTHDAIDYGSNDYTKTPTVTENHYDDAYYNRLVKVADGIDNHDAVTREQVQYIGGIYGTDKNDSNYGGRGATGTNSVAIGSNAVATEDNVVSFGNPDIPAVNIPESRKITHSVSLSDTDKTAINNVLGFDVTNDENWSKISGFKDWVIVSSLGSATEAQDRQKLANNPEFMELFNKVDTAVRKGTLTQEQWISFEKYANGTEVETTDAVNIPAKAANYRRVVNMADGINPHDAVAMEQLEDYAKTDASNIGNSNENKDDWGEALGVDSLTTAGAASNSNQLITGKTLYNYDKPNADGAYVKLNQTTGQNLSALDTQVKANTDALTKPNHNIKYYAVDETTLPKLTNFNGKDYSNEKNNGAKGMGSIAAGFNTHADGIASTVAGSYSGVINQNSAGLYDLRGATALSYGTFNINQNTDTGKIFSGVANSIVGQANATTDSNAAIIYGAGNTVTNSYRKIDDTNASEIMKAALSKDVKKLDEALQKAVPTSGGQVMVMGGGNNVESAYMTQVVGVGNTVKGNQVQNAKGEWVTDTSKETAIKDYDDKESSQYNYVDGFNNEVINGKHDYIIGANNKLSGDSYDDDKAHPNKRSNKSNIIIGDNHTLSREQNTVIIGSSDTENTQTKANDAVIIGHNANATSDTGADNAVAIGRAAKATGGNAVTIGVNTSAGENSITIGSESHANSGSNIAIGRSAQVYGYEITNAVALGQKAEAHVADGVAIGSGSIATVAGKSTEGYDPATGQNSTETTSTWKATNAAVSIGTADGKVTRQINGVAAGTNDTDAVNVAQLKSLQSGLTSNLTNTGLKFAANSGNEYTAKLGTTVKIQGTDKTEGHEYTADNLTTEIDKDGNITILMDKNVSAEKIAVNGKDGENGKPGTAGSIGISGQDGKAGVGIDGKDGISIKGQNGKDGVTIKGIDGVDGVDGAEGHIGLNGKDGMTDIFTTAGTPGLNGKDGETMTRIVYKDPKGTEHEAATLDDGLKFKGDDGKEIAKKLNNTLDIIGGAKGDLTEGNIGVNSTDKGQLKVQLAKDLKGITSISNQKTEGGKTTGAKITLGDDGSVNVNGGKITNVGSGADASGKYTETTNAANIGDVQKIAENTATGLTGKGLKFAANSGDEYTAKLGSTVKIQGTAKKAGHEYTADNLTTEIDKDGNITILMDKNVSAEKIAVNGKDGENGKPGTAGSIGISGQDGKAGVGIDGKDGISIKGQNGKDGVTIKGIDGVDGVDGAEGHIGLNGKDGMTDIFTTAGTPGLNGKDGETMTRIVYKDPKGTEHEAATLDDGLKFKGDDGKEIAKKLNNTLDIIGGAKGDLTEGNIGVNSTDKGQLKVQLAKDLKGITSISNQKTEGGKTTGAKITLGDDGSVNVNGGKITNVGSGADASGNYTTTTNAANIGDVQKIVKDAVDSAADTTNKALAGKANVDASNIGANLKGEDGKTPATEAEKTKNENAWGSAIGTGKIEANNGQLVTGKTVYEYNKPVAEDGKTLNYVSEGKTTGQNLGALDAQVKNNADAIKKNSESIQNITNNVKNLSDNAVQYDKDSNKTKVTLGGDGGTIITNVKDGALSDSSSDAVNGKQLYNEQEARKAADKVITEKVTNNTNEITKIKDGEGFTDKGKTVIKSLAQDAVDVKGSDNVTVTNETKDGTKTFTVSVDGNGKVASGDKGLISGDTIYNELRPSADGSYIKKDSTTAQNLVSLDTQVKKTSDLINSDGKTIKIGGSDAATKIDVNGKDGKGRVITGVVSDANDPTSAANVGYVNGVTAANTQQIYRDMNNAYGRLNNNINKAAAGSNALAALHPLDYDPDDKADFAVGYGHYRNANAAAVGAFYHPNENTMVNVGVSLGNGDPGFNAGVSFKVGRGGAGREAMSKTEMAKVINSQSKEIDALKKDNADKDKRIDALEQKMAEILAKLDKNGK